MIVSYVKACKKIIAEVNLSLTYFNIYKFSDCLDEQLQKTFDHPDVANKDLKRT